MRGALVFGPSADLACQLREVDDTDETDQLVDPFIEEFAQLVDDTDSHEDDSIEEFFSPSLK